MKLAAKQDETSQVVASLKQQSTHMEKQLAKVLQLLEGGKKVSTTSTDEQIKDHVEEVLNDFKEQEEKKNNLVLYGLAEGNETEEDKNKETDVKKTKEILNFVNPEVSVDKLDTNKIKRIGTKRDKGDQTRPRPIKIEMDCPEDKMNILRQARTLKDSESFKNIGLSKDKTKKEQMEYKILKDKLAEKMKNAKDGQNFKIFRGKIVLEADIPAMIRKHKESQGTGWSSSAPVGGTLGGQPNGAGAVEKSDQAGTSPKN